jgi:hypothetical protein
LESRSFWLDTIPLSKNRAARRATSAQFPRSVRRGVRRNVRRLIRATSGELSGQLPGNYLDVSGQLAGNFPRNAGECPQHGWRNGSQVTWQFPLKSTPQITKQTG